MADNGYKIETEQFQGPLGLLLSLIEKEKLEITQISLAQVTNQFLEYLDRFDEKNAEEMADFLLIAAKLLHLKSKAMLPLLVEEDDEIDLEKQLKIYKEFLEASKNIKQLIGRKKFAFFRPKVLIQEVEFNPPKNLSPDKMSEIFKRVISGVKMYVVELPKRVIEKTISLKERIGHIQNVLLNAGTVKFSQLIDRRSSKTEKIVSFLAMLELVKQRMIHVSQDELFQDITLTKKDR